MNTREIKELESFLAFNKSLTLFKEGVRNHGCGDYARYLKSVDAICVFRSAFGWDSTVSVQFWRSLDARWITMCIRKGMLPEKMKGMEEDEVRSELPGYFIEWSMKMSGKARGTGGNAVKYGGLLLEPVDYEVYKGGWRRIEGDRCSMQCGPSRSRLTFSREIGSEAFVKGMSRCRLMKDGSGLLFMMCVGEGPGERISFTGQEGRRKNASVHSKGMVGCVAGRLGVDTEEDSSVLLSLLRVDTGDDGVMLYRIGGAENG